MAISSVCGVDSPKRKEVVSSEVYRFGIVYSYFINLLEVAGPAFWADSTIPIEIVFLVVR